MGDSTFARRIGNIEKLIEHLNCVDENDFIGHVYRKKVKNGEMLLAFRNKNATIYYEGQQLCNMRESRGFAPQINNKFLPSKIGAEKGNSKYWSEEQWQQETGNSGTFVSVLSEICGNIESLKAKEGSYVADIYKFSPLCKDCRDCDTILLDIEAMFAWRGENRRRDQIDVVLYNLTRRQLVFVEVKRLGDVRWGTPAEINKQLGGYSSILESEKAKIVEAYNNVIIYYSKISGMTIPPIDDKKKICLGLLITEYTRNDQHNGLKLAKEKIDSSFHIETIGHAVNVRAATLDKWYKTFSKS